MKQPGFTGSACSLITKNKEKTEILKHEIKDKSVKVNQIEHVSGIIQLMEVVKI